MSLASWPFDKLSCLPFPGEDLRPLAPLGGLKAGGHVTFLGVVYHVVRLAVWPYMPPTNIIFFFGGGQEKRHTGDHMGS